MKSIFTLSLLFIANGVFVNAQCYTHCYVFSEGKRVSPNVKYGLYQTAADFVSGSVTEPVEKIEMQYDGLQIRADKQSKKHKYEELVSEYWGFVFAEEMICRLYTYTEGNKTSAIYATLQCSGTICLYGTTSLDGPVKNDEGGYNYTSYCYTKDYTPQISLGLEGNLLRLTSTNFATLLSEIDEDLSNQYKSEFGNIKGVKPDKSINENKESMQLFIKYFELVNNGSYKK